ncbi:MAG: alpha-galactosidase [Duncaniella sp.]|nr:alpha-galactosidase [Duncaniella sp.]MDE6466080.1 alpha-galactosidase [Duncaniella sp.]MDE6572022.1 alpha-galactosidase [Duncaniella sp.]
MKQSHILRLLAAVALGAAPASALAEIVDVSTPGTSLVLDATEGQPLKILYYGDRLSPAEAASIQETGGAISLNAYPVYGIQPMGEAALSVTHADGNRTTDVAVTGVSRTTEPDGGLVTTVAMKDRHYPLDVNVNYRVYPGDEIIETWVDVKNGEKGTVTLNRFMSGYLPVRYGNVWMHTLYGTWADEANITEEPVPHGIRMIKNKDGLRNTHTAHPEVMLSLDGKPRENDGRVIGATLCYPGNYKLFIDTDDSNYHHLFAGINEENSEYHLRKGESFTTPELALTYSDEGLGGVSRNFHRWGRKHRLHAGDKERKILLNSWEGVYFSITEPVMAGMMEDIASMGGELFVMDDGWFGDKYPRDVDNSSLGDWVVDTRKLPNGINGLLKESEKNGIKFGIWIEPEMTNTVSELYEKHPEYIVKAPNREVVKGRGGTQLVLDLANPKVQDLVFEVVDTLMTKYPAIDYIKWDANAPIMEHGSQYLTADNQSHLYIDFHKGLEKTLDRIRAAHPDVTIQACASGGGRVNWGFLPWFDEFWTSDNNDALQRVYMQWGTSYFYPAIAMASHISASPNHQTFRRIPTKFRADVAMSGRLGLEMQPRDMNDDDKAVCRQAISDYKTIRPIVQFGDLYRLQSPYDKKGVASLMYITPEKDDAVFFWWKLDTFMGQQLPRIPMAGLNPDKTYRVQELNRIDNEPLPYEGKTFTGRYLMSNGLEMPLTYKVDYHKNTDYSSRVLRLTEVK